MSQDSEAIEADNSITPKREQVPTTGQDVGATVPPALESRLTREELTALFNGDESVPPPWATDCAVKFDVWLEFSKPSEWGLNRRIDLILSIHEDHGTGDVVERLQNLDRARPIATGGFVVASLSLPDLVRRILPVTNLADLLRLAQDYGMEPIMLAVLNGWHPSDFAWEPDEPERRREHNARLGWFLNLLSGVVRSASEPVGASPDEVFEGPAREAWVAASVAEMVETAIVDRQRPRRDAASRADAVVDRRRRYPVAAVTTNRPAFGEATRSRATVKADAAEQLFSVDTTAIGWAVVDSGIDATHPAFAGPQDEPFSLAHRVLRAFDFVDARRVLADRAMRWGLIDWRTALPFVEINMRNDADRRTTSSMSPQVPFRVPGNPHGTHVAGILGGSWSERNFRGLCPTIKLYDFRVLNDDGIGAEFSIVAALQAIRYLNDQAGRLVIAGVNLSLSVPHDVATHSCGWTPVCQEAERLVRSGVVVVASAGNAGYAGHDRTTGTGYRSTSISDPGNADAVITVGSTHRSDPHRHGVSYFSGRGPTADGRPKPDLLAPGEDIDGPIPDEGLIAMHGTSQAAAHVSGAAAMLMARHRELVGRPERVKQILCATATDLARERAFQGHGLVDVLRALQSI
ncbi:S8 family serine peptidase [Actinoplanes palleronii]|uniref:Peptidase S8/S53 domain-containing protein n=1 Tax=Actinoplanes palleronii TaxID=113570 RepID=A0ABQ4B2R2_9ACTN|nr:S8 family serine peptidase [Actinoplanes palleronii]GIE64540.1 hypothetical protein Apa02nite_006480 [Actinoplanes palleronii]